MRLFLHVIFFRVILPTTLLTVSIVRPSVFGLVYLSLGFASFTAPFARTRTRRKWRKQKLFTKFGLAIVASLLLIQILFQIILAASERTRNHFLECQHSSVVMNTFGIYRQDKVTVPRLFLPEIVAFLVFLLAYLLSSLNSLEPRKLRHRNLAKILIVLTKLAKSRPFLVITSTVMLYIAAALYPCVLSIPYFLTAMIYSLYFAIKGEIYDSETFIVFARRYSVVHMLIIYVMQLPSIQIGWAYDAAISKLAGVLKIWFYQCSFPPSYRYFDFFSAYALASFCVLIVLYALQIYIELLANWKRHEPKLREDEVQKQELILNIGKRKLNVPKTLSSFQTIVQKGCWALTILSMFIWALIYHNWFSFVFLVIACLLCLLPKTINNTLRIVPFISIYATVLIISEFFLSLRNDVIASAVITRQIGFVSEDYPFEPLIVKAVLTIPFFVAWNARSKARQSVAALNKYNNSNVWNTIVNFCVKYFVYFCIGLVLIAALRGPISGYSVLYMICLILLISMCNISWNITRRLFKYFWLLLAFVALIVLLSLYIYQFYGMDELIRNSTQVSEATILSLGLVKYPRHLLFAELLLPIVIFLAVVIQLKAIHKPFMSLIDLNKPRVVRQQKEEIFAESPSRGFLSLLYRCFNVIANTVRDLAQFIWRLCEIHWWKVIAYLLAKAAVDDPAVINYPLLIASALIPLFHYRITTLHYGLLAAYIGLLLIIQMCLHMPSAAKYSDVLICDNLLDLSRRINRNITRMKSDSAWAGFGSSENVAWDLRSHVVCLFAIAFHFVLQYRQTYNRVVYAVSCKPTGVVFVGDGYRQEADKSICNMVKYFINFIFHRFGLEMCFVSTAAVIAVRMDLLAVTYAVCLLILMCLPRSAQAKWWKLYLYFLIAIYVVEYFATFGIPLSSCHLFPWPSGGFRHEFAVWFYLPDYFLPPNPRLVLADFFQILFVSCQLFVFEIENSANQINRAGANRSVLYLYEDSDASKWNIPTYDFVAYKRSYLDYIKHAVFLYSHWITLVIILLCGLYTISIPGAGYAFISFYLLWSGNDIYFKPVRKVIKRWKFALIYCTVIIALKSVLQLFSCAIDLQVSNCFLAQLFAIACLSAGSYSGDETGYFDLLSAAFTPGEEQHGSCPVVAAHGSVRWDALVLAVILLQIRIFGTHYFRHIIRHLHMNQSMADGAAVLFDATQSRESRQYRAKQKKNANTFLQELSDIVQNAEEWSKLGEDDGMYKKSDNKSTRETMAELYRIYARKVYGRDPTNEKIDVEKITSGMHTDGSLLAEVQARQIYEESSEDAPPPVLDDVLDGTSTGELISMLEHDSYVPEDIADGLSAPSTPSMSWLFPDEDLTVFSQQERKCSVKKALKTVIQYGHRGYQTVLRLLTSLLSRYSYNYRYVTNALRKREGIQNTVSTHQANGIKTVTLTKVDSIALEAETRAFSSGRGVTFHFLSSLYFFLVSKSELLCYILILLVQLRSGSLIGLALAFSVFLFAALCVPRPPRLYWVLMLVYVQVVILAKYLFLFNIWTFNTVAVLDNEPFTLSRVLGIGQSAGNVGWDVALLIALFFHRYTLKRFGLWSNQNQNDNHTTASHASLAPSLTIHTVVRIPTKHEIVQLPGSVKDKTKSGWRKFVDYVKDLVVDDATDSDDEESEDDDNDDLDGTVSYSLSTAQHSIDGIRKPPSRSTFKTFVSLIRHPRCFQPNDYYTVMFLCDLVCFLTLGFGYSYFAPFSGATSDGVVAVLQSNKVPLPFLFMMITQMVAMIIDRAIYVRRSQVARLVYHLVLVILVHIWMFFIVPAVSENRFIFNIPAGVFYVVKCIYFLTSAMQIKAGYPLRSSRPFFAHGYSIANHVLYKIFMTVPFLFELRTIIDWIWTDTNLGLMDFFAVESIYNYTFDIKCTRTREDKYPPPFGVARAPRVKYGVGCPTLIFVVVVIWLPLLLFSMLNAIGERNIPEHCSMSVTLQGFPALYQAQAGGFQTQPLSEEDYEQLSSVFYTSKYGKAFLNEFEAGDVILARFPTDSQQLWSVSEPTKKKMVDFLNDAEEVNVLVETSCIRPAHGEDDAAVSALEQELSFGRNSSFVRSLAAAISGGGSDVSVVLPNAYLPFMELPPAGEATEATSVAIAICQVSSNNNPDCVDEFEESAFLDISLSLGSSDSSQWWRGSTNDSNNIQRLFHANAEANELYLYVFAAKVFPSSISSFASSGIIGIYIFVIYAVSQWLRGFTTGSLSDIMWDEVPSIDCVHRLCLDIYLVREVKNFVLEINMYEKLIFLFRSTETMIDWTVPGE